MHKELRTASRLA